MQNAFKLSIILFLNNRLHSFLLSRVSLWNALDEKTHHRNWKTIALLDDKKLNTKLKRGMINLYIYLKTLHVKDIVVKTPLCGQASLLMFPDVRLLTPFSRIQQITPRISTWVLLGEGLKNILEFNSSHDSFCACFVE